jgi:hypothetical protein
MNFLNKPGSDILLQIGVLEEKKEKKGRPTEFKR